MHGNTFSSLSDRFARAEGLSSLNGAPNFWIYCTVDGLYGTAAVNYPVVLSPPQPVFEVRARSFLVLPQGLGKWLTYRPSCGPLVVLLAQPQLKELLPPKEGSDAPTVSKALTILN